MMDFYDVLDQVVHLLRQRQRVSYRALKRQFQDARQHRSLAFLYGQDLGVAGCNTSGV